MSACFNPQARESLIRSMLIASFCTDSFNPQARESLIYIKTISTKGVKCFNPQARESLIIMAAQVTGYQIVSIRRLARA